VSASLESVTAAVAGRNSGGGDLKEWKSITALLVDGAAVMGLKFMAPPEKINGGVHHTYQ